MRIAITPIDARLDQPVGIEVADLQPGSRVRLRLRNHTLRAEAQAMFIASPGGRVEVAAQAPVGGDYEGLEPAGLFWSARFDDGCDVVTMIDSLSRLEPLAYTLTAISDDGSTTAREFTRRLLAPNVVATPIRDGRLRGTLFAANGATNAPGVVVLGGSDGGTLWAPVAAHLAAHGMTALCLAYFAYDDLPDELIEIPLEYFADSVEWLRRRPEVGAARVGVLGMSRGGEAALLLGATYADLAAVVALVPSGITGGGNGRDLSAMTRSAWTLGGVPLPILPPAWDPDTMSEVQAALAAGQPIACAPGIIRTLRSAGARLDDVAIRVERTCGPVFMMSAEDDQLWASARLTEIAEQRLSGSGFGYPFEHRRYPGAGHFAVLLPDLPATSNAGRHPLVPFPLAFGGLAKANAAASADLWPRIVSFLHRHLSAPSAVSDTPAG